MTDEQHFGGHSLDVVGEIGRFLVEMHRTFAEVLQILKSQNTIAIDTNRHVRSLLQEMRKVSTQQNDVLAEIAILQTKETALASALGTFIPLVTTSLQTLNSQVTVLNQHIADLEATGGANPVVLDNLKQLATDMQSNLDQVNAAAAQFAPPTPPTDTSSGSTPPADATGSTDTGTGAQAQS
jgi:hypothetical protein